MSRTFSAEDEEQLRQLHADGVSRNEIARQMGWGVGTITNRARRLGLSFDRSATRAAVEARQVDLTARRQRCIEGAYDLADEARSRAFEQYELNGFDHVGNPVTHIVRRPPAREFKDFNAAFASALTTALKLEAVDKESDTDKAKAALGSLGQALSALYGSADDYRDPGAD
ncbi:hypothetical protein OG258_19900 [Streptomyces mirabilis]|uniref:hypothetical protein n=1 Tax=Streptomyces mirabilis TaxID=68239 RepID=UPI002E2A8087|nr:hypothetical protein [Streptomyces mirabilis]